MSSSLQDGFTFLISTAFDLYLFVLIVRLVLVWAGVNYHDPITQFIVKLTNFVVKPLRRIIPNIGRLETATIVIILLMEMIKFITLSMMSIGMPTLIGLLLLAASDTLKILLQFFFYAILIQAIMSWIQPQSPIMYTLYQITSPIMRPVQRLSPPVGGIDISPILALIGLQFFIIVLINPLTSFAIKVAYGG